MRNPDSLLIFTLDDRRYALPVSSVDRVVRIVAVTLLPKAPDIVSGVINVQGRIIPVVNLRRRFGLPERELVLTDQLVVAHTARRTVALVADAVLDVIACPVLVESAHIVPGIEYLAGVAKLDDGLILIHDLDRFLSLEEENLLSHALENSVLETP